MRLRCPHCDDMLDQSALPWVKCHKCDRRWMLRGIHATAEMSGLTYCLHLSENDIKAMMEGA